MRTTLPPYRYPYEARAAHRRQTMKLTLLHHNSYVFDGTERRRGEARRGARLGGLRRR